MEVFKTRLFFEGFDEGNDYLIDTIFVAGQWWLVRSWLENVSTGERTPERLVRLSGLQFQEAKHPRFRFLLNNALPKSVYDGQPKEGYVLADYRELVHNQEPSSSTRH